MKGGFITIGSITGDIFYYSTSLLKLSNYTLRLKERAEEELVNLEREIEQEIRNASDDNDADVYISLANENEYFVVSDVIPSIINEGLFLKSYFLYENYIIDICDRLFMKYGKDLGIIEKLSNTNGRGVVGAIQYLTKIWGIPMPNINSERFKDINKIRNGLVHRNGILRQGTNLTFPDEKSIIKDNRIEITFEYVNSVISIFTFSLTDIFNYLESKKMH